MRALAKSGDRCGAIRQYARCVEVLREDLGVQPEPETVVLEQMIRAGQLVGAVREQLVTRRGGRDPIDPSGEFSVIGGRSQG